MKTEKKSPKKDERGFEFELREATDDAPAMLIGYAARFNAWSELLGWFTERIRPGSFKKALMKSDVRMLMNHDSNQLPLGRTPKTLRLVEDTKGLRFENDLPDTEFARNLVMSIQRGDLNEMSFGFSVAEGGDEWVEKDGISKRTITEVDELFDISPVNFGAYKTPRVKIATRTLEKLEECRKSAATSGDDKGATARELELMNMNLFDFNMEARRILT